MGKTLSSENNQHSSDSSAEVASPGGGLRRSIQFVALFILYVLILLVGYRFAINSEANMRYLFTVAKHTSMVLNVAGESCELEPSAGRGTALAMRRELAKWRNMPESSVDETASITAWEAWLYRAYRRIQNGQRLDESGPYVHFVASVSPAIETAGTRSARPMQRKSFNFIVVPDCGAIPTMAIFFSAVLAFPTRWRKRLIGIGVGIPMLYAVNISRLSMLAVLGALDPTRDRKWFTFVHEYVWQGVFLLFVVAVWMLWVEFVVRRRSA